MFTTEAQRHREALRLKMQGTSAENTEERKVMTGNSPVIASGHP
jgi:hypothetical protein